MSKTPDKTDEQPPPAPDIASDGSTPDPTADLSYLDDPIEDPAYLDQPDDPTQLIYWQAGSFASALLANPRADQLLRLPSHLGPASIGHDLAEACWHIATAFNRRLDQLRQAAQNDTQEQAQ